MPRTSGGGAAVAAAGRGRRARGFAALTVVMVLFFIMALVAAYFNRTVLVEQRMGSTAYRGMRAAEAADAGIDWTLALLNAGRVDAACEPSSSAGDEELRQRLFNINDRGEYVARDTSMRIGCVFDAAGADCICPTQAAPSSLGLPGWRAHGGTAGFRVRLSSIYFNGMWTVGLLGLQVEGCGTGGQGAAACTGAVPVAVADGIARHRQYVGLLRNLPLVPPAALTVGGALQSGGHPVVAVSTDAQNPITVHTGQPLAAGGLYEFQGPAGSADDGRADADAALAALVPTAADAWTVADRFFRATFQLEVAAYRDQPGVIKLGCPAAGCSDVVLTPVLQAFPQRAIWVDGDLTLGAGSPSSIGSDGDPVMLIVKGRLTVDSNVTVKGFVYAEQLQWGPAAAAAVVDGAVVVVRDATTASRSRFVRNAALLQRIQTRYGSWVRMPNAWSNQ